MAMSIDNFEGGSSNKLSVGDFFNHVFNFNSDNKANMLNLLQYILIGLIPIVLTLKGIKAYIPEEDDTKGCPEILLEVTMQLFSIFFSIWFIDRVIRYIPTYSGIAYHKFNEINFVLPLLIILVTMQTKLGSKINILFDRAMDIWNGNQESMVGKSSHGKMKVSQPIVTAGIHQISRADTLDNSLIQPPQQQMPPQNNISMIDNLPNMVNSGDSGISSFQNQAIQNSFMESIEPMAANGALGGGFGASF
tara:strand:+ start:5102 stop:5848 length:747 start_codon:yes stop_codon:yes gene_type:complete